MIDFALRIKPQDVCLVPERRAELTTEGGLDVVRHFEQVQSACLRLAEAGIRVSLFIDADPVQIDAAAQAGAPVVEIHTGHYADAPTHPTIRKSSWSEFARPSHEGIGNGLQVNAGHGLHYHNVQPVRP